MGSNGWIVGQSLFSKEPEVGISFFLVDNSKMSAAVYVHLQIKNSRYLPNHIAPCGITW